MEKAEYAATVIEQVHLKTFQAGLQWKVAETSMRATPVAKIDVTIRFEDHGPDAAIWEAVLIKHPVGEDTTMVGNPTSSRSRIFTMLASGKMLAQVNEIFSHIVLNPRKSAFEAAMKELCGL